MVSVGAFATGACLLQVLVVHGGVDPRIAQAASIVAVTPLSFLLQRGWSFRPRQATLALERG